MKLMDLIPYFAGDANRDGEVGTLLFDFDAAVGRRPAGHLTLIRVPAPYAREVRGGFLRDCLNGRERRQRQQQIAKCPCGASEFLHQRLLGGRELL